VKECVDVFFALRRHIRPRPLDVVDEARELDASFAKLLVDALAMTHHAESANVYDELLEHLKDMR
jgi:hypothetical protein